MRPTQPWGGMLKHAFRLLWLLLLLLAGRAEAHQADTSYTRIELSDDSVRVTVTFDLYTITRISSVAAPGALQISRADVDRAAPEINEFIRQKATLKLDGVRLPLSDTLPNHWREDRDAVPISEWQTSLVQFGFVTPLTARPRELSFVVDFFEALGDRHTNLLSVEQAGRSDDQIALNKLEPGYACDIAAPPSLWSRLARFVILGVKHIFGGYDHLLFLIGLIAATKPRDLLKIITAFTVAHTITLALSALRLVTIPMRWVELAIALTIMYVAIESLWRTAICHRWMVAFGFGLIHGFGFANVLRDLTPSTRGFVQSLLAFNVGVELGQIALLAVLLPLAWWLKRQSFAPQGRVALSAFLYLFGAAWLVDRAFGLRLMPF